MRSKAKKIVILAMLIILVLIIATVLGSIIWYNLQLKPVQKENGQVIRIEIEEGSKTIAIADMLEKNNVIKNANAMKLYAKLNNIQNLQAGKYDLNNSEDLKTILSHIQNGEVVNEEVKITFVEGKNMRSIAKVIAENTDNTEEDVFNLLKDEDYIDSLIEKYWFLTEHKDEIKYNMHELLTLASIAELEGVSEDDRKEIVGVLVHRLREGMSLGSDVTAYYAFKVDMGERDLYAKELNTENPYNTRGPNMEGKLPVGPICSPSREAINAAINYTDTDNLYFVADKNKKVYFTKTYEEHTNLIKQLKSDGLWYEYN